MTTVFLGGICNGSTWREELISKLDTSLVDAFNPVVTDWNKEAQENEIWHRINDDLCLYVITPELTGFYSIAEVIDDSNKRPEKTIFCVLEEANGKQFDKSQMKGFLMIQKMIVENGGTCCSNIDEVANYLNNYQNQPLNNKK